MVGVALGVDNRVCAVSNDITNLCIELSPKMFLYNKEVMKFFMRRNPQLTDHCGVHFMVPNPNPCLISTCGDVILKLHVERAGIDLSCYLPCQRCR